MENPTVLNVHVDSSFKSSKREVKYHHPYEGAALPPVLAPGEFAHPLDHRPLWDERTWPFAKAHLGRVLEIRRDLARAHWWN